MKIAKFSSVVAARTAWLVVFFAAALTTAQAQKYEITPLFGGTFGGTLKLQQQFGARLGDAQLENSMSYGIAAGIRFDGEDCQNCDLIEFRWMRQETHLGFPLNPLVPPLPTTPAFRTPVTFDHYLGDFTHEFTLTDVKSVKPFVTGTLGAARMGAPASATWRFVFGIGGGMKVFPTEHFGFRIYAEYLPMVMSAEVQSFVCAGGCIVVLNGGVMNQFKVSIGPSFRF